MNTRNFGASTLIITFLLLSNFSNAFAAASPRDWRNGKPYIGSCWQKLKQLPYERCEILHSIDGSSYPTRLSSQAYMQFSKPSVGALASLTDLPPTYANYFLTCWTGTNNFAYAIPIHPDSLKEKGLSLGLMGYVLKLTFPWLEGKKLSEIEGTYSGFGMSGAVLGGSRRGLALKNGQGVYMKLKGFAGGIGLFVGMHEIFLGFGADQISLYNPLDIMDFKEGATKNEIKDVSDYTFVKTNYKSGCQSPNE